MTGDAEAVIEEARKAFWVMVGFLAVIWGAQVINWALGYRLSVDYGIHTRDPGDVTGLFTAPLLHLSWAHLEGNSGPLFIFGFLAAFRGVRRFWVLTALVAIVSGVGAWLTSAPHTVTAGASGVVFGYFGYVIVRGFFDRHRIDIVVGVVMALCFAYQFAVLLPQKGVSWQGHVFGFAAGIAGGWVLRERRPSQGAPAAPQTRADLLKELDDLGL
jgi:membrane associated rhomboid family serine protease